MEDDTEELRLLLNLKRKSIPIAVLMDRWSLMEAVGKSVQGLVPLYQNRSGSIRGIFHGKNSFGDATIPMSPQTIAGLTTNIEPLVNLLLYICSDDP